MTEKPVIVISPATHPKLFQLFWKIQQRVKQQQAQAKIASEK